MITAIMLGLGHVHELRMQDSTVKRFFESRDV